MDTLTRDLRFAFRSLRRTPALALAVVASLALCIGATTSIFSVVHAVLFRPFPFADPDGILVVHEIYRGSPGSFSVGNWADVKRDDQVFQYLVPLQRASVNLAVKDAPENVRAALVGSDFFSVLGVTPAMGRVFRSEEARPGADNVVVLSDRIWRGRFGADPGIVGHEIRVDGRPRTVVGVMPRAVDFAITDEELWLPAAFTPKQLAEHDEHFLVVLGRLKRGVTRERAQAELDGIATTLRERFPEANQSRGLSFTPLLDEIVSDYRPRLFVLLGAVGFVLLIACANIAGLLLARSASRAREVAVRTAVGASRGHIVRQVLTEALMLALAGGLAGIVLANWAVAAIVSFGPADVPRLSSAAVDVPVMAFALLVTLASGLAFGLAPALRMAGRLPHEALKEGGRTGAGAGRDRLRSTMVIGEIALALVLLTGAGLLIRSGVALNEVDPGFDPHGVVAGRISLPEASYPTPERVGLAFRQVSEALERAPGIEAAALVSSAPLEGGSSNGLVPEGRPLEIASAIDSDLRIITPGYFRTMHIALLRGRAFTAQDGASAPRVMIINEALAREAFPGQDALGKRIACCEEGVDGRPAFKEVIGIAADVRARGLSQDPSAEFYLPMAQAPAAAWGWLSRSMTIAVRGTLDPAAAGNSRRAGVRTGDRSLPVFNIGTMNDRITGSLAESRFSTMLLSAFGVIALLLAAIGVYGLISHGVSQRTQEIGIRMALGARAGDVLAMVVRHGAALAGAGLLLGLAAALALTRLLTDLLFRVSPTDPPTFAAGVCVLTAVAILAAALPARRASRVDPAVALRND